MLDKIYKTEALLPFLKEECCENEVCISFDAGINKEDYVVIKVDEYYNGLKLAKTPPSPDCLIIRKCEYSGYGLTIVELKNIQKSKRFDLDNMISKFNACINDFIMIRFKDLLFKDYADIKLYFVSKINSYDNDRDQGLKLETLIETKFHYNGKKHMIRATMPNPTIKKCYQTP
jgi:hypothetical protein